jgi:polyhydroxybutyrate depolymerase
MIQRSSLTYSLLILLTALLTVGCLRRDDDDSEGEKVYRFNESMTVDGRTRTYILNLPPNYYESSGLSLVIAMHGGGGEGSQFESTSLLTEKANEAGFVVVYPDGVRSDGALAARTWNAGRCCDYARDENIDDVKFIGSLIDALVGKYKINAKKVYATGHSNGGMLSYRLACEVPGKIAAIAVSECSMVVKQPCNPSRAVPVLHMHSVKDSRVPYTGGVGITGVYFPPIDSVMTVWSDINACGNKAQVVVSNKDYTSTKWSDCDDDATIEYYLTQDGGHAWPGGLPGSAIGDTPSKVINANDLLWEFFQQHPMP